MKIEVAEADGRVRFDSVDAGSCILLPSGLPNKAPTYWMKVQATMVDGCPTDSGLVVNVRTGCRYYYSHDDMVRPVDAKVVITGAPYFSKVE